MVREIREKASARTGIPEQAIMLSSSHTHSGPSLDEGYGGQGVAPEWYWNTLVDAIAGSIYEAWKNRAPARIGTAAGEVFGIGVNRRSSEGIPIDPSLTVLKIEPVEPDRQVVLMNYTCHAVVLGPDNLAITADYPGYAMRVLEKVLEPAARVMFTNGAAGDVNTGHSADLSALGYPIPGRTFQRAEKLGNILAGAVLSTLQSVEMKSEARIAFRQHTVDLPRKAMPSLQEVEAQLAADRVELQKLEAEKATEQQILSARVRVFYSELLIHRIKEMTAEQGDDPIPVELQAVAIGDTLLLAVPVEMFVSIGLRIKQASPFERTIIVGYTNGHLGYLPCRETYEEGGYEAVSSRFAPESADRVEAEFLELAKSLKGSLG